MKAALFLGNSHASAFKLAYDEIADNEMPRCAFFCAKGADLAFTEVVDGKIKGLKTVDLGEEELNLFHPAADELARRRYLNEKRPEGNVPYQFASTGGTAEIDLSDIGAIFYVCGVSPYDFIRLDKSVTPISSSLRKELLARMLGDKFLLHRQIEHIRDYNSECRHYFIGSPLAPKRTATVVEDKAIVADNRWIVRSQASGFLFDDVFMPPDHLLDDSLLYTKAEYSVESDPDAETRHDPAAPANRDAHLMSKGYGRQVFGAFIEPLVRFA